MTVPEVICNKFIEKIESGGILPWVKPWKSLAYCNAVSKREYRGINVLMLAIFGDDTEYLTFNQAKAAKGTVKKGAKGIPITFYAKLEKQGQESKPVNERDTFMMLRYFTVFNLSDCDGVNINRRQVNKLEFTPHEIAEKITALCGCPIKFGGNSAHYSPLSHAIAMPAKETFLSIDLYYKTLFHEITHSLAKTALSKDVSNGYGSEPYAKEELVAELGANFFLSFCGIDSTDLFDNSAAYFKNWLGALKDDSRLLISAMSDAQKRFDYVRKLIDPPAVETTGETPGE